MDAYVDRFRALVKKAKLGDKGAGRHQVPARSGEVAAYHPLGFPVPALYFRR